MKETGQYPAHILLLQYIIQLHFTNYILPTGEDVKPHVDAGPDVTIALPQHMAILNGSLSHDGFGIQSYQWIRSPTSPAAGKKSWQLISYSFCLGNVVGESDKTSVLMLSELINGTYNYTLVVTNNNGQTNEDNVTLTVKEGENDQLLGSDLCCHYQNLHF